MSQPKGFRRLDSLTATDRAEHDRRARQVIWRELVSFDREASADPADHGDQPYEPGPSLMDRERRGAFTVEWTPEWAGGLLFTVDDGVVRMGSGGAAVTVMLDRQQCLLLLTALFRWRAGTVRTWKRTVAKAFVRCVSCDGAGWLTRG